ncbi:glycerol dehydrogenase [Saccharibacter sp. 17.LH.SD]|uniref:glycerol dehydrogenase n=1 Tax=Saccharibacter sp. 17.LH.SD TaxID=2689393 RepID=UPI0013721C98|nr:glycerol dehydrogenase [Saccharibacter sp. 17.LH.SD]MXV44514.1 glycerol dehydrogenase [Saccharibacter sp. 17.LH.SD]
MLSSSTPSRQPLIRAAILALAGIITLFGLYFVILGTDLAFWGGSWYYVLCGILLVASGVFLFRLAPLGAWLYIIAWGVTIPWSIYEVGFDLWGWVPRLFGPTLIVIPVLVALPFLYKSQKGGS